MSYTWGPSEEDGDGETAQKASKQAGNITHPSGRTHYVPDELTYLEQHPETLESTRAAVARHPADRRLHAVVPGEEIAGSGEARRMKEMEMEGLQGEEGFAHWCVGGRVVEGCGGCRGSFEVQGHDGADIGGLSCEKCEGTKVVWSDCALCVKVEAEKAEAEKAEAEKVEGEKVKAEKLTKGKRVGKAAGDGVATPGSGASPKA
ncbi:hypothetical protein LTR29_014814 [Friedmanniomyces endolithicus]|uniref:Uncharacterized protein n=1 Tax=Friedmanniomyces endolithicus TaxID=329885 RepID=A0A4U0V020_9PEZI|nr:hypothetical protein LTS09_014015 [Friedmanniomyces endolithicus]KAK0314638.1 hypothetical protein LTR01_001462 [Friedmanniomyces endolithicus]KAK0830884.1 hypothetical protein LTR73_003271 [Friedmanniomyces endolithicus]KAK0933642.1 hypothetical protein LTR29_014814 [Friedmanniomyces endolithicus]TKA40905.1 hypothetical protein B0A54_07817 [Friedmanniomyces endolithicus]